MPVVFEPKALDVSRRKRQNRIEPIQRLNRRLFIDTEDCGMLRRIQIQSDDVSRFGFEVWIIAGHVPLQPIRFQPDFLPDAMHCILADT